MTKKFLVQVLNVDGSLGEESYTLELKDNAIVEDLKEAFSQEDIYDPDQLRVRYKIASGNLCKHKSYSLTRKLKHFLSALEDDYFLEDDDFLEDIRVKYEDGDFVVQCPHMRSIDGAVFVFKKEVPENVNVLIGSTKSFDHHKITHDYKHILQIPLGSVLRKNSL